MKINKANRDDLPGILELQKIAYISEAQMFNNFSIPPLTETIEELEAEYTKGLVLKALDESYPDRIVGSVRGYSDGETLYIGKLIVLPDYQNRGIGKQLLKSIEEQYPNDRYELFTSTKSLKNIAIYEKAGYREFKREQINDILSLVYLEKTSV